MIVGTHHPVRAWQVWEYEPTYELKGAFWELIVSPDDSMPIHRLFDFLDIESNSKYFAWETWSHGTIFRHRKSGKLLEVYKVTKLVSHARRLTSRTYTKYRYIKPSDQLELQL